MILKCTPFSPLTWAQIPERCNSWPTIKFYKCLLLVGYRTFKGLLNQIIHSIIERNSISMRLLKHISNHLMRLKRTISYSLIYLKMGPPKYLPLLSRTSLVRPSMGRALLITPNHLKITSSRWPCWIPLIWRTTCIELYNLLPAPRINSLVSSTREGNLYQFVLDRVQILLKNNRWWP
jgi:hypothetical protein